MVAVVDNGCYKVKDAMEWTPAEVCAFISEALPGHPCLKHFQFTAGRILCALDKEDIRRQAKDDEAANVIWAELPRFRKLPQRPGVEQRQAREVSGSCLITIFVRTPQENALQMDVAPSDTVASVKARLEAAEGTPAVSQRLIFAGVHMADERSLAGYGVGHGAVILLVPQLNQARAIGSGAKAVRGMLMIPGSRAWQPSHPARPYLPVVCTDAARNFVVSLEFGSVSDYEAFAHAAQVAPATLEVLPGGGLAGEGVGTTEVRFDADTEMVHLARPGGLAANAKYECVLRNAGELGEGRKVCLVTGNYLSG